MLQPTPPKERWYPERSKYPESDKPLLDRRWIWVIANIVRGLKMVVLALEELVNHENH